MSRPLPYPTAPRIERIRSAYTLAREGLGWEDIVVRSRGWPSGEISRAVAWAIVQEVQGTKNA
ncbi:MAG: hypothetical protein ACQEUZ_06300 [Pseudomonadota bacterium]